MVMYADWSVLGILAERLDRSATTAARTGWAGFLFVLNALGR